MRRSAPVLLLLLAACARPDDSDVVTLPAVVPSRICGTSTDLLRAPPPRDGVAAVDLLDVTARVEVRRDGHLHIDAQATFLVGEQPGQPAIAFVPQVLSAELDGQPAPIERVPRLGARWLRVDQDLPRCSTHTLRVTARIAPDTPVGRGVDAVEVREDGLFWAPWFTERSEQGLLEQWLPANLLFDQHALTLDVLGPLDDHQLVANGTLQPIQDGWRITWPDGVRAHGPLWVLSPRTTVSAQATSAGGVRVLGYALPEHASALQEAVELAAQSLDEGEDLGRYVHGDAFLLWMREDRWSMEYDGATISGPLAIPHEVAHSFWGRGVHPDSSVHGWLDEGLVTWATHPDGRRSREFTPRTADLLGHDPWQGPTSERSHYRVGSDVFADLAWRHGEVDLLDAIATIHQARAPDRPYSTLDVARELACLLDDADLASRMLDQIQADPPPADTTPRCP